MIPRGASSFQGHDLIRLSPLERIPEPKLVPGFFRLYNGETTRNNPIKSPADMNLELELPHGWNWNQFADFFSLRAIPGVEAASPDSYRRTFSINEERGAITVRPSGCGRKLAVATEGAGPAALETIRSRLMRVFDLGNDAEIAAGIISRDDLLKPLVEKWPGLRLPSAFDPFEQGVRTIIGQQISVKATVTITGRLAARLGEKLNNASGDVPFTVFPGPDEILGGDLSGLGLSASKETAIRGLALKIQSGGLDLENPGDPVFLNAALTSIPGIGEWTAQYFAMRALGQKDAFPASDLGLLKSGAWGGKPMTPRDLLARAENWRPFRAYAAVYLWKAYGG